VRELLKPRWIAAHVVVLVVAVVFVNLGFWQLRRLEDRKLENLVADSRYEAPPAALSDLLASAGGDLESLRYRRTTLAGEYDPENEVLTRNQVYRDQAGFHVVTPFLINDGTAILINRGWVPLELDVPPIQQALPPDGALEVSGWLSPSQVRPALGPTDPANGILEVMSRIDIGRIQTQVPYDLAPVYLVIDNTQTDRLPVPLTAPAFDDEGPHLAYAIQWFGFTLIGIVGYFFLARKSVAGFRRGESRPPGSER